MLPNLKEFSHPKTIAEAVQVLARHGHKARPLAGGTAVTLSKDERTEILVDLTRLGLENIRTTKKDAHIECCVTAAQLAKWHESAPQWAALSDAAAGAGPAGVRNAETIGGSLAQCFPWSDLPVALLALQADVEIAGPKARTLGIDEMLDKHPSKQLAEGEFIQAIRLERKPNSASAFFKDVDTEGDYALASAAVSVVMDTDRPNLVQSLRIALGAVRPLPVLVPYVEDLLNLEPDDGWFERLGDIVTESVDPLEDMRAGSAHRRRVVTVMAKRAARKALERAGAHMAQAEPKNQDSEKGPDFLGEKQ